MMITLSHLYADSAVARAVVDELKAAGLPEDDIGIIAPSRSVRMENADLENADDVVDRDGDGHDDRGQTINRSAGIDVARQGFPGHQAVIDRGNPVEDGAVCRNVFSRPHQHAIAGLQRRNRHARQRAGGIEPVREFAFQRSEIAGKNLGLPPHRTVEIAAAQQEEHQHDGGIKIRVGGVTGGFVERQRQSKRNADGDRHVHVQRAIAHGAPSALIERLAGVSRGRQHDQRREPVKQIARHERHIRRVARPNGHRQQHHVHRGEARNGEAPQQPLFLPLIVGIGTFGRKRMGVIADGLKLGDDVGGSDLAVVPIDRKAPLRKIEPGVNHTGQLGEPALDLADAAGAADAIDGERHVRRTGIAAFDKLGKVDRFRRHDSLAMTI